MKRYTAILLVAALVSSVDHGQAVEPPRLGGHQLNALSLELSALQTLYGLQLTAAQMRQLSQIAKDTADTSGGRQPAKATDKYQKVMLELRDALIKAKDDERIQKLSEELDKLTPSEKPEFDDGVDVTDAAHDAVPKVLRLLTPAQAASFLGGLADTVADPRERLEDGVKKVRGLKEDQYRAMRDEVVQEVSSLVAGLDAARSARVNEQVTQLLILARGLKDDEVKKQQPALEKRIQAIIGDMGPMEVLRHVLEEHLAELLSNPQLETALTARLK